ALVASAYFSLISSLLLTAQRGVAERYLRRLDQITESVMDRDPIAVAWGELSRYFWMSHVERDPGAGLLHARRAVSQYDRSGAGRFFPWGRLSLANNYWHLGLFDLAEKEFSQATVGVPATGKERLKVENFRAQMRVDQQRFEEASALAAWSA